MKSEKQFFTGLLIFKDTEKACAARIPEALVVMSVKSPILLCLFIYFISTPPRPLSSH